MSFGTIITGILVVYAIYYIGNIIYDLYFKKSPEDKIKTDEEEVDIGEIAESVIQTQEINKNSLADYMPPADNAEIEGDITCEAMLRFEEMRNLISLDNDNPNSPFRLSKIAHWVSEGSYE